MTQVLRRIAGDDEKQDSSADEESSTKMMLRNFVKVAAFSDAAKHASARADAVTGAKRSSDGGGQPRLTTRILASSTKSGSKRHPLDQSQLRQGSFEGLSNDLLKDQRESKSREGNGALSLEDSTFVPLISESGLRWDKKHQIPSARK